MTNIEQMVLLDAAYERAAIVAWLRQLAFVILRDDLAFADEHASALEQSANTIERGEHWSSPPIVLSAASTEG